MPRHLLARLFLFCAVALLAPLSASATVLPVTMAWSPVGNPGNAANPLDGYGAVNYSYNIGTYDVTCSQYVAFLNANDPTGADPVGVYSSIMSNPSNGGVEYNSGAANGQKYSVVPGDGNHPQNCVTLFDTIRFANWMDNGQAAFVTEPTATHNATDNGSYTLLGYTPTPSNASSIVRNTGATIFLSSESEWEKAAFYNPATKAYFSYPTSSNTAPNATGPTATPNSANYDQPLASGNLTNVGAYTGTKSPYGAFDMAGDVYNWTDTSNYPYWVVEGVAFESNFNSTTWDSPGALTADFGDASQGFRLTELAPVPEPNTLALAALAGMGLIGLVWRRRRSW
jgi:formylglycine-generating enzyme